MPIALSPRQGGFLIAALLIAVQSAVSQTTAAIAGQVVDSAGTPVAGARVLIPALGRQQLTGADGRFRFTALNPARYDLTVARVGFAPATQRLMLGARDTTVTITLRTARVELAAVQVTATPAATAARESPQPTAVLEGAELRRSQGAALGETLEGVPGVRSLSMTTGIGKPVIRGMTHYRVVTLDNGQRTETQAWGHDHSPNVETASAERVEVIKGPASVLYGSDALGGVINVIAPAIPDAIDGPRFARGQLSTVYNHGVRGTDGTLSLEGATGGLGARLAVTARGSGDMRTPDGPLDNTTNRALSVESATGYRASWGSLAARVTGRDERIEIFDDPAVAPGYTGFQRIATRRATLELTRATRAGRLQLNGGFEHNDRREFASAAATDPDLGLFVRNWTGFAHLHHERRGPFTGTLGVSAMTSDFENRGTKTLIPSSRTRSAGVYLFEQAERGRWRTTLGARYDVRSLATDGNEGIDVAASSRNFSALTGSLGVLYRLSEPVSIVANLARGFRAPAAPDLFANGFHEGTRAFERGNPDLRVETSLNSELGVRLSHASVVAEASAYVNRIDDYIYLRPFGAGGGVFDSMQVVQGNARIAGVEGRLAWRASELLTVQLSGDYTHGENTVARVPLTFIPPLRVVYGVRLEDQDRRGTFRSPFLTLTAESNAKQTRLDPRDSAPDGYTLLNASAGFTVLVPRGALTVDLSVRNVADARYRSFMSRYKEFASGPGRALVLRVTSPL